MTAAEVELLVLRFDRQVNGARVVGGVDIRENGDDVGVGITQADDLEAVAIDVADVKPILPHVRPPELPELRAGALEEFQSLAQAARLMDVRGQDHAGAGFHASLDPHFCPASSWRRCQFSRRSSFARKSVSEGLPSRSKCL